MQYKLINYKVHGAPYIETDAEGFELTDVVFYVEIQSAIDGAPTTTVLDPLTNTNVIKYKFIQTDFTEIKLPKTTTAAQLKIDLETKVKDYITTNYGSLAA